MFPDLDGNHPRNTQKKAQRDAASVAYCCSRTQLRARETQIFRPASTRAGFPATILQHHQPNKTRACSPLHPRCCRRDRDDSRNLLANPRRGPPPAPHAQDRNAYADSARFQSTALRARNTPDSRRPPVRFQQSSRSIRPEARASVQPPSVRGAPCNSPSATQKRAYEIRGSGALAYPSRAVLCYEQRQSRAASWKLAQKAYVVLKKRLQVGDAVSQHRQPVHAHSKRESG